MSVLAAADSDIMILSGSVCQPSFPSTDCSSMHTYEMRLKPVQESAFIKLNDEDVKILRTGSTPELERHQPDQT